MEIYVVQPNDTVYSIAAKLNVSARQIIRDNEITTPNDLVSGQTLVIVYPTITYVTKAGDTLESIATLNNISQLKLLQNNPFLSDSNLIPGETLAIQFNTSGNIITNGYIYPYVDRNVYKKTLPYLTYITVYNYKATDTGELLTYYDDNEIIQLAKEYGTIPLLMATTLSAQGEPDADAANSILLNESYQQEFITSTVNTIKQKGYLGLNIVFNYMNINNLYLYTNLIANVKNILDNDNLLLLVTINPNTKYINNELSFEQIDYKPIIDNSTNITFLQFVWGVNYGPPLPVNSIARLRPFIDYVTSILPADKILVGNSLISYDWQLPYVSGVSYANSLSINSALRLAMDVNATIQFDELSQSPYFNYSANSANHVVWTVDARSIDSLVKLVREYNLEGAGFWNLMIYAAQLWLVINTQFEIIKLIPSKFD